jgi:hypothetical protein
MRYRVRQCVECPKCLTRYLVGSSPYRNGSSVVPVRSGSTEEYVLYCQCHRPAAVSRWMSSELKSCTVSRDAYFSGYGNHHQIVIRKREIHNGTSTA